MQRRLGSCALGITVVLTVRAALAAGPSLIWSQMGSSYRSPDPEANWGFCPREFNGTLLAPMGDYGACVVKRWTGSDWVDDFLDDNWGTGRDFENLTSLTVYNNKLYMTCETDSNSAYNHGVMVRDSAGNWSVSLPYTRTAEGAMQFGSFGMAVFNGKLYTGVVPYAANTTLTIYEHNGSTWTAIKNYRTGEQLRAWSLGSDGTNLYVGIGTRGRNNAATLGIERYDGSTWASELAGKAMHSMAFFKGSMYAGGNGRIYKRNPSGVWTEVLNTGQAFVIGMTIIDYGNGMEILYAGTENRPRLYATSDGAAWDMMHEFDTTSAGCYVGQFQNTPVASVTYFEGSTPKVVKVWRGSPQDASPVITEVSPDPDWATVGTEYIRQLSLAQGTSPITWSVIDGPAGTQVDSTGRVHGWTPAPAQAAQAFTLTVRATNSAGSDDESWLVQVISPPADTIAGFPFNSGAEGWTLQAWRSSIQYDPGYAIWDSAGGNPGGNLKAGGNGATNNADSCTREGGLATRQISTVGFTNIQIEYDVMAALNSPPAAGCDGGCVADILEGSCEDKLVVYYSTSGTGGPWAAAEQLNEGTDLPTTWTHKVISLAAVPAANDNPDFAVQFKWQFNTITDAGRIDNVIVKGSLLGNNGAPQVDAGPDQTITLPNSANLTGTVSDDGLPNPPGEIIVTWSKQSGPGTVTFNNVNALQTTASFGTAGVYVLRLLATDSQLTGEDLVTITVNEPTPADFDGDGDVDQTDFGIFQACLSGTAQTPSTGCEKADLDGDGDVDQSDFAQFYDCLGGADSPPGC